MNALWPSLSRPPCRRVLRPVPFGLLLAGLVALADFMAEAFAAGPDAPTAPATNALVAPATATATGTAASATSVLQAPVAPPLPEITLPLVRVLGALAIVLVLFVAGAWLVRNWQTLAARRSGRPARLRLLEVRSLGGRHALYVVAYDRQRLLVAASPTGLSLIDRLPPAAEDEEPAGPEPSSTFAETLRRILPGT